MTELAEIDEAQLSENVILETQPFSRRQFDIRREKIDLRLP